MNGQQKGDVAWWQDARARREAALARLRFLTGPFAVVPGVPRTDVDAWLDKVIATMPDAFLDFDWVKALQAEQEQVSAVLRAGPRVVVEGTVPAKRRTA